MFWRLNWWMWICVLDSVTVVSQCFQSCRLTGDWGKTAANSRKDNKSYLFLCSIAWDNCNEIRLLLPDSCLPSEPLQCSIWCLCHSLTWLWSLLLRALGNVLCDCWRACKTQRLFKTGDYSKESTVKTVPLSAYNFEMFRDPWEILRVILANVCFVHFVSCSVSVIVFWRLFKTEV